MGLLVQDQQDEIYIIHLSIEIKYLMFNKHLGTNVQWENKLWV